jgi:hypothetical protein
MRRPKSVITKSEFIERARGLAQRAKEIKVRGWANAQLEAVAVVDQHCCGSAWPWRAIAGHCGLLIAQPWQGVFHDMEMAADSQRTCKTIGATVHDGHIHGCTHAIKVPCRPRVCRFAGSRTSSWHDVTQSNCACCVGHHPYLQTMADMLKRQDREGGRTRHWRSNFKKLQRELLQLEEDEHVLDSVFPQVSLPRSHIVVRGTTAQLSPC